MPLQGTDHFVIGLKTVKQMFRSCRRQKRNPRGVIYQEGDTLRAFFNRNRRAIADWYAYEFFGRTVVFDRSVDKLVQY